MGHGRGCGPCGANYVARAVDPLRSRQESPRDIDRGDGECVGRGRKCGRRKERCYYFSAKHRLPPLQVFFLAPAILEQQPLTRSVLRVKLSQLKQTIANPRGRKSADASVHALTDSMGVK